jgi:hypothetical protein
VLRVIGTYPAWRLGSILWQILGHQQIHTSGVAENWLGANLNSFQGMWMPFHVSPVTDCWGARVMWGPVICTTFLALDILEIVRRPGRNDVISFGKPLFTFMPCKTENQT